jgi:hypothetical protein
MTLRASNRDITVDSYDVSFSGTTSVDFLADSAGSGTWGLSSSNGPLSLIGTTGITLTSTEETLFEATGSITFAPTAGLVMAAPVFYAKGDTIAITSTTGAVTINANGGITFRAPGAFVDFQDDLLVNDSTRPTLAATQTLRLPQMAHQAERQTEEVENARLPFVEGEVPGCVERQIGVDDTSLTLCVCDHNKVRSAHYQILLVGIAPCLITMLLLLLLLNLSGVAFSIPEFKRLGYQSSVL